MRKHLMTLAVAASAAIVPVFAEVTLAALPDLGPHVLILDPSTPDAQAKLNAIYARQERNQFGEDRDAILFKPGKYALDLPVGFYTHVAGLGASPDDVTITGRFSVTAGWMNGNATCNFWRAAENLSLAPTSGKPTQWAVSQGTMLRRVHVRGDLHLWDGGWSSGGFLADSKIDGKVVSGSQQQWISRNCEWGRWDGGVWNMVFVGVTPPPQGEWPKHPLTVVDRTPVVRERPFLTLGSDGALAVRAPATRRDSRGVDWQAEARTIPLDQFHVARPDRDDADSINAALAAGKHLLLTPGVYHLKSALRVAKAGTIVLGLGYPTLVPEGGEPAVRIADVAGVTVAGLMIDAGATESPTLVQVGEPGAPRRTTPATDPICITDIFCRAGGARVGSTKAFVTVDADDVVGDNLWLWRADHGAGAAWDANRNANGIVVNGDRATVYGLFVEHTQQYQTVWNGNGGRVYFYQSEMPYDPPSAEAWRPGTPGGWASYKVADRVTTHEAWGVGVYSYFRDAPIVAARGIETPDAPGVKVRHAVAIRLNGRPGSGIARVINDRGDPVIDQMKATAE